VDAVIKAVSQLDLAELSSLIAESGREGWQNIRRLADEWTSGANRFNRPGEQLFLARIDGQVVGVCGLNFDPYAGDDSIGRIRRLYVLKAHRRQGVGRALVRTVVDAAAARFRTLHVRTNDAGAGRFYEAIGFEKSAESGHVTHCLALTGPPAGS
jgi:GNAT superfamily N-acetyltransferase